MFNENEGYRFPSQMRDQIECLVWLCLHDVEHKPIQVVAVNAESRREQAIWN